MAVDHPEWKNQQPFKAVLENDMAELKNQEVKIYLESEGVKIQEMIERIAGFSSKFYCKK